MIIETESLTPPISIETTDNQVSQLGEFTSLLISRVDSLSSAKQSLEDKKEAMEKANSDIEDQNYVIEQDEEGLLDAKEKLEQHYIYVPFDGVMTEINVKKGDSVSSGTAIATLITQQKIAEITLNEVDATEVKVGQKVTITFDAIDDLSVAGEVTNIDSIGTVSQGVVTYSAQISLDLQDERVKPGMSVSTEIITKAKQDVLLVPNAAIKSQNNIKYVQVMGTDNVVYPQEVETGISNDTYTEITNGLAEGDKVVTQTVSTSNSSKSSSSSFGPANGGSMEMMRMIR
jgi:HlyD family secretion protein